MNPDFDYLLWAKSDLLHNIYLAGHLAAEHTDVDGRLCCRGQAPAYVLTITADYGTRKLSEIPL
jgi:hypothetical protein